MEIQKATCPNCGANITNMRNCEFCGSLLIRLQQQGINITAAGYADNNKVLPGLISELQKNLDLQAQNPNAPVVTDIFKKVTALEAGFGRRSVIAEVHKNVADEKGNPFFPDADFSNGQQHLMVCFLFDSLLIDKKRYDKFKKLDIYHLFTHRTFSGSAAFEKIHSYTIDFGNDAEGAARLLSRVLHEVYDIGYNEQLEYNTYSGSADSIEAKRDEAKPWYERYIYWIAGVITVVIILISNLLMG